VIVETVIVVGGVVIVASLGFADRVLKRQAKRERDPEVRKASFGARPQRVGSRVAAARGGHANEGSRHEEHATHR
jgi:hypothetical protein